MDQHQPDGDSAALAVRALRETGYPLVLTEVSLGRLRCDVVAYAPGRRGEMQAMVAVKIQRAINKKTQVVALEQLAAVRHQAGTRQHYVFDGHRWFAADSGLSALHEVAAPLSNEASGPASVTDEDLVRSMLLRQLKQGAGERPEPLRRLREVLESLAASGSLEPQGQRVEVPQALRWQAAREVALRVLASDRSTSWSTHPVVARAIAEIASQRGSTYLDPFCGPGTVLWALADRVADRLLPAELRGLELNAEVLAIARSIGAFAPAPVELRLGDAFRALASPRARDQALDQFANHPAQPADGVISQLPLGRRLSESYDLSNGDRTTDGDLASLDLCLRALEPGGRAVLQTPRSWTYKSGQAQRYRSYLRSEIHIAALIGLPSGGLQGTNIPSLLVVIENAPPAPTFVAQLDQDWQEQLAPEGHAMHALLEHLEQQEST